MGIFQYLKYGFFQQPVDNYFHTIMYKAESAIGHTKKMNAKLCVGPRPAANVLFDYAEKFATTLSSAERRFFGFFWGTSLTHDYLNIQPKTDVIYLNLLENLVRNGVMNNTIVIVMSDHGIRWGSIRETYQGRIEERLPLVYFMLPPWFEELYPQAVSNLKRNRRMLSSPYDLHETLMDILNMTEVLGKTVDPKSRGISFFSRIPEARTCDDAGIAENWCTCHESRNISIDDRLVLSAAGNIVEHLNQKLFSYIQCAQLTLKEVGD